MAMSVRLKVATMLLSRAGVCRARECAAGAPNAGSFAVVIAIFAACGKFLPISIHIANDTGFHADLAVESGFLSNTYIDTKAARVF